MNSYYYHTYGIDIKSHIRFPELIEITPTDPDISFIISDIRSTNNRKEGAIQEDKIVKRKEISFLTKNSKIIVDPSHLPITEYKRHYLLGVGLADLLAQWDGYLFNAGCVGIKNKAFVLLGKSDAGKSTIGAALYNNGYRIISDSIVRVVESSGELFIYPGFPCLKLEDNTPIELKEGGDPLSEEIDHYRQYYKFDEGFRTDKTSLCGFFILKFGPELSISKCERDNAITEYRLEPNILDNSTIDRPDNIESYPVYCVSRKKDVPISSVAKDIDDIIKSEMIINYD